MKAMLLSSMGAALDNIDNEPPYVFYYISVTNDIIYNPSQKKLYFVKKGYNSPPLNSNEVLVELPLIHDQYFKNAFSNRVYKWDAIENDMIETTIPASEIDVLFTAMLKSDESIHIGQTKQPEDLPPNKIIFFDGGKFDNYLLTGSNNIIVVLNDNVIFNNCEFAGTFCYSSLKATNFGCVSGITETSINWEYGAEPHLTTENGVKQYGGTDNTNALNSIGQFCSGSDHVKIEFNGNFFSINANSSNEKVSPIVITSASNLELCGSSQPTLSAMRIKDENGAEIVEANTNNDNNWAMLKRLVTGFKLINCNDVEIHHLSFIGLHSPHAFPPRYGSSKSFNPITNGNTTLNSEWVKWGLRIGGGDRYYSGNNTFDEIEGEDYTLSNTYSYSNDGVVGISIAAVSVSTLENKTSERVNVHDCNFTMRCNGVIFGGYDSHAALKNSSNQYIAQNSSSTMWAINCRADHIYWQPVGFHCTGGKAKDFYVDYCGQPIDISTFSNNCSVDNVVALRCCYGPKQECNTTRTGIPTDICRSLSHDNSISNCDIEISDDIYCIDTEAYILHVAQGASNSHFLATDCKFTVYSRKKTFVGVQLENDNVTIRNTEFYIDVQTKWNLVSSVGYYNPVTEVIEYGDRYVYQSDNGLLDTDIPKLFYGNNWQGSIKTNLILENTTVNMTAKTSIHKVFTDFKSLCASNFILSSTWNPQNSASQEVIADVTGTYASIRNVYMYITKIATSRFSGCELTPVAQYFSHSKNISINIQETTLTGLRNIAFCLQGSSTINTMSLFIKNSIISVTNTLINIYSTAYKVDILAINNTINCVTILAGTNENLQNFKIAINHNLFTITGYEAFRLSNLDDINLLNCDNVCVTCNLFNSTMQNNNIKSEIIQTRNLSNPDYLRTKYAYLFWNNLVDGNMNDLHEGPSSCLPTFGIKDMIYHQKNNNNTETIYMYTGQQWVIIEQQSN